MNNYIFRTLALCMLLLLFSLILQAQSQGNVYEYLDGNQVKARVTNSADMFWDLNSSPSYEVPIGSGKHSAFASAIWLGGLDPSGNLHVSAQTYRQQGTDFSTGPYRSTGQYADGLQYSSSYEVLQVLSLTNGKIVFTGQSEIQLFDPANGSVVTFSNPNGNSSTRTVELANGDILVYGNGIFPQPAPYIIIDGTSFTGTPSITPSVYPGPASATLLPNGEVLLAGGFGCTRFDPVNQVELTTPPMNQARFRGSAMIRPDGKVFVAGGSTSQSGTGGAVSGTQLYDPVTNTWSTGPNMSIQRLGNPIVALNSGEWMLAGGNGNFGDVDHYDPNTGTMVQAATLDVRMQGFTANVRTNGDVVVATRDLSGDGRHLFVYTPGQNTVVVEPLNSLGSLGTVLPNGNLFVEYSNGNFREIDLNTLERLDQPWEKIWKVTQAQIDQFRADQAVGAVNFAFYPDIETWPAHGDTSLGELPDQAPYIDVNNDGNYDPLNDGDYPCIKGDQALWWTYNDDAEPNTETGGDPLGVQVKTMAYAYDCDGPCPTPGLDHATFYQYTIVNPTSTSYSNVYLGYWLDTDIGNFVDDYIGCDTALGLGFSYNGDANDDPPTGYGTNPPALGSMFLSTPGGGGMTNFMSYENDFSLRGNPETASHYYGYMQSFWKDGTQLVDNGQNGYSPTAPGPVTNYALPGDAGFCGGPGSGWSDLSAGNPPFDRRYLQSYGPFNLNAGGVVTFEVAVIWARGFYNDNLGSVCELKKVADSLPGWFDVQLGCNPSVVNITEPVFNPEVNIFPNPTQNLTTVAFGEPLAREMELSVIDPLGRNISTRQLMSGSQRIELSTSSLADGVYLLKFQDGEHGFARKLVVRH